MITIAYDLAAGKPPVAPPLSLSQFKAEGAGLAAGVIVKVDASGAAGAKGKAAIATATGADAVGVTVAAAIQDADVRIQYLTPSMVLKGTAAAELQVGDTCQFNATLDGFDDGTGTNCKVLRTEKDSSGDHKIVYCVVKTTALW